jgi:hypothetical protein
VDGLMTEMANHKGLPPAGLFFLFFFSAFSDDCEDSFGVPHHEYLPVLSNLNSLPPFAM